MSAYFAVNADIRVPETKARAWVASAAGSEALAESDAPPHWIDREAHARSIERWIAELAATLSTAGEVTRGSSGALHVLARVADDELVAVLTPLTILARSAGDVAGSANILVVDLAERTATRLEVAGKRKTKWTALDARRAALAGAERIVTRALAMRPASPSKDEHPLLAELRRLDVSALSPAAAKRYLADLQTRLRASNGQ
jgi:hypothetical protein